MPTLKELVEVGKAVAEGPVSRTKSPPTQKDLNFKLAHPTASNVPGTFSIFVRLNTALPDSFSVGLVYESPTVKPLTILRVNGSHAPHKNPDGSVVPRNTAHIHQPYAEQPAKEVWAGFSADWALQLPPITLIQAWDLLLSTAHVTPDQTARNHVLALTSPPVTLPPEAPNAS
jgi:hypothetical protein